MELHFLPCFHPRGFNCKSFSHSNFLSDFKLIPFYTHSLNMNMNISQYKHLHFTHCNFCLQEWGR